MQYPLACRSNVVALQRHEKQISIVAKPVGDGDRLKQGPKRTPAHQWRCGQDVKPLQDVNALEEHKGKEQE